MKSEEALKELSYDGTAYGGKCTHEVRQRAMSNGIKDNWGKGYKIR